MLSLGNTLHCRILNLINGDLTVLKLAAILIVGLFSGSAVSKPFQPTPCFLEFTATGNDFFARIVNASERLRSLSFEIKDQITDFERFYYEIPFRINLAVDPGNSDSEIEIQHFFYVNRRPESLTIRSRLKLKAGRYEHNIYHPIIQGLTKWLEILKNIAPEDSLAVSEALTEAVHAFIEEGGNNSKSIDDALTGYFIFLGFDVKVFPEPKANENRSPRYTSRFELSTPNESDDIQLNLAFSYSEETLILDSSFSTSDMERLFHLAVNYKAKHNTIMLLNEMLKSTVTARLKPDWIKGLNLVASEIAVLFDTFMAADSALAFQNAPHLPLEHALEGLKNYVLSEKDLQALASAFSRNSSANQFLKTMEEFDRDQEP